MKRIKAKKVAGLKKWNKIVSILVKDYKKQKLPYDIKEVRAEASAIYKKGFKAVVPSKLRVKDVIKTKKEVGIPKILEVDASNIDQELWFRDETGGDKFGLFFNVGNWATKLSNAYPTIPIMVVTKNNQSAPLIIQGYQGSYDGSPFQELVENMRMTMTNPEDSKSEEVGEFFGEPISIKGKIYALFYDGNLDIDVLRQKLKFELDVKPTILKPKIRKIVEKLDEEETQKILKPKKRGRPKGKKETPKKKPLTPIEKKPLKPTDKRLKDNRGEERVKEIRGLISDLEKREDRLEKKLTKKLITKSEYRKQQKQIAADISDLTKKLKKGGSI